MFLLFDPKTNCDWWVSIFNSFKLFLLPVPLLHCKNSIWIASVFASCLLLLVVFICTRSATCSGSVKAPTPTTVNAQSLILSRASKSPYVLRCFVWITRFQKWIGLSLLVSSFTLSFCLVVRTLAAIVLSSVSVAGMTTPHTQSLFDPSIVHRGLSFVTGIHWRVRQRKNCWKLTGNRVTIFPVIRESACGVIGENVLVRSCTFILITPLYNTYMIRKSVTRLLSHDCPFIAALVGQSGKSIVSPRGITQHLLADAFLTSRNRFF
jgi:hypothetical protein